MERMSVFMDAGMVGDLQQEMVNQKRTGNRAASVSSIIRQAVKEYLKRGPIPSEVDGGGLLTKSHMELLEEIASMTGKETTEVLMDAINLAYQECFPHEEEENAGDD